MLQQFHSEKESANSAIMKCAICGHVVDDAQQGPCGCFYCRECLVLYLTESLPCYQGDRKIGLSVELDMVLKDSAVNRQVFELQIEIPKHMRKWLKTPMSCPYSELGCLCKSVPMETLAEHLQKEIIIHNKLLVEWIRKTSRDEYDVHDEAVQPLRGELEGLCRKISDVLSKKQVIIAELFEELNDIKWKVVEISKLVASLKSTNDSNINDISNLKVNNEIKIAQLRQYFDAEVKKCQQDVLSHRESAKTREAEVRNLRQKISKMETQFSRHNSMNRSVREKIIKVANFTWCVENIKEMRTDGEEMIYSGYFYSICKEYKMRLWLFPNGNGDVLGDDVSIQLLVWHNDVQGSFPFKADVTMSMKNVLKPQICQSLTQLCLFDRSEIFIYSISEPFHFNYNHLNLARVLMDDLVAVECVVLMYK